MKKKIIFYAPLGSGVPQHKLGGGEKGCKRTREILINAGYDVISVDKPVINNGFLKYLRMVIGAYLKIWTILLIKKGTILYVVGFYEKNVYLEFLIILAGKINGCRIIYEARNGRFVKAYWEYSTLYKTIIKVIINKSDLLFVQGLEYVDFIEKRFNKSSVYTPNYVLNKNLRPYTGRDSFDLIRIIYTGRVTESKNIELIISVAGELKRRNYKVQTMIIGAYTAEYRDRLEYLINEENLETDEVILMGRQSFDVISMELEKGHFFLFPSREKKEGHSNSLTEAMTFGVVPIVSTAGFNSSIVADKNLIIEQPDVLNYVNVIERIISTGTWQKYSKFVYNRIKENYTENIVKKSILTAIENL